MKNNQFMDQKMKDMSAKELAKAVLIKLKSEKKKEVKMVFESSRYKFSFDSKGLNIDDKSGREWYFYKKNSLLVLIKAVEEAKKRFKL